MQYIYLTQLLDFTDYKSEILFTFFVQDFYVPMDLVNFESFHKSHRQICAYQNVQSLVSSISNQEYAYRLKLSFSLAVSELLLIFAEDNS